jgi:hypothetical protein
MKNVCNRTNQTLNKRFTATLRMAAFALLLLANPKALAWSLDTPDWKKTGNDELVVLQVAEPYIEMHTGPGRGYPVFNVVEQGESVEILIRRTDWYKIRTTDEKTGWTSATSLARTLQPTGVPVDLPEISHGDYLASSWRVGFTVGKLEGDDTFSLTVGYRPLSWLGAELEGGMIFGNSVTSDYYGLNLVIEPEPDWMISPYVSAGAGLFSFNNRHKVLVSDTGSQDYGSIGVGAGYYIGRNFVLRGEYRSYSVSSDGDRVWLNAWKIGLNSFF